MNRILFLLILIGIGEASFAQYVYTIKADSVKITNSCDTAELIIENHTQTVHGFLFNKGRGRTEFRRPLQQVNDNLYLIGADSLKLNAWMQGGNTWGTTGILGTKDNNHLDLYTNNAFRARLTNAGNLLIGTTTDDNYRLNVSGGPAIFSDRLYVNTFTGDYGGQLFFKNEAGSFDSYIGTSGNDMVFHVRSFNNSYRFALGPYDSQINREFNIHGDNNGVIHLGSPNNHLSLDMVSFISDETNPINITSNSYSNMDGLIVQRGPRGTYMLDPIFTARENTTDVFKILRNGYVGIGANSPQAQLHTTGTVRFSGLTNDSSLARIVVCDSYGNLSWRDASSLTTFNGTMNADLAVNGTVSAQKLVLSQTGRWPDYVFSKQYQLPSLTDVENFIDKNKHLPGIPSAAEVKENGVDVAQNQAALLKEIEELTLYIIKQDKELKDQNKELELLKKQIGDLMILIKGE